MADFPCITQMPDGMEHHHKWVLLTIDRAESAWWWCAVCGGLSLDPIAAGLHGYSVPIIAERFPTGWAQHPLPQSPKGGALSAAEAGGQNGYH